MSQHSEPPSEEEVQVIFEEDWNDSYTLPQEEKHPEELESSTSPKSPSPDLAPPIPEPIAPKKRYGALQLRQPPTKKQRLDMKQQEQKTQQQQTTTSPMHWIAQWAKDNLTSIEINCLLGKSSLVILEHEELITTSFTSPPQKTGGITASLEKLLDPKSINVLKLHVFSAFWSILLPAMIVQHLSKFSPNVIKRWQSASLIRWELILNKTKVMLEVPKGEIIYFEMKAQNEPQFKDSWIKELLGPMKTYLKMPMILNNSLISVRPDTMTLELNRMPFINKQDSTITQDVQNLSEKIKTLSFNYVKTKLSTKGKPREYYATRLKGLQFNLTETSENDLQLHYVSPKHWYFKNRTNKEFKEQNNTNSNMTHPPTTPST